MIRRKPKAQARPERGKYGAILCDPPWAFRSYARPDAIATRKAEQPYKAMSLVDLMLLPVFEWAARDCALFLWIPDANLKQGMNLAEHWGFEYKTVAFIWDKGDRIGMGFWSRKQAEQVYMFTRGKPKRLSAAVPQMIRSSRREHSRKPDEIYKRVEALVPGPYLEMFARQKWPRWDCMGDETSKFSKGKSK
jgi:N6-adenosine-specific RNA methylase IME4